MRVTKFNQAGAFGIFADTGFDGDIAKLIKGTTGRTHEGNLITK
jgi:hypothetical protein